MRKRVTIVLLALALAGCSGSSTGSSGSPDPSDTRSCGELQRDFNVASETVQRFDRGTVQFETAETEKWAAWDQANALDCTWVQ